MDKAQLPARVTICEVGPRDGLQNEKTTIATDDKLRFVELLTEAGMTYVETTSFVSPRWVPQLADHDAMMRRLQRKPSVFHRPPYSCCHVIHVERLHEVLIDSDVDRLSGAL